MLPEYEYSFLLNHVIERCWTYTSQSFQLLKSSEYQSMDRTSRGPTCHFSIAN